MYVVCSDVRSDHHEINPSIHYTNQFTTYRFEVTGGVGVWGTPGATGNFLLPA